MDYESIEDLVEKTSGDLSLFMQYLLEFTSNQRFTLLERYAGELRTFKKMAYPLRHVLALTVLERIAKEEHAGAADMFDSFKTEYKEKIEEDADSYNRLSEFLTKNNAHGIYNRQRLCLVNFDDTDISDISVKNKVMETAFPVDLKNAREFVQIYRETIVDLIYLDYKLGFRNDLALFDINQNHYLSEWILKNRKYDFIFGEYLNVDVLSYRMWEILDKKTKRGLFD